MELWNEISEIKRKVFGDKSVDYAISLNALGICYKLKGDFDNALKFLEISLEILEGVTEQVTKGTKKLNFFKRRVEFRYSLGEDSCYFG